MIALVVVALLFAVAVLIVLADRRWWQPKIHRHVDAALAESDSPIYDRLADELAFTAKERPFSAGVETDVVQALRNIADDVDPIDPARVEQIRARVLASDELAQRRGGVRR